MDFLDTLVEDNHEMMIAIGAGCGAACARNGIQLKGTSRCAV